MKDFTLYPEALELKQLGFDEPCMMKVYWLNSVHKDTKIPFEPNVYINGKDIEFKYSLPKKHPIEGFGALELNIPTYAQAFRWFREKHNLIGGVEYIGGMKPTTTWWDIYVVGHYNIDPKEMSMKYQPYEKAEQACLVKLIEIVKESNK
jgi:hypothetical protein